ncbi:type I DNA topoisomerase [Gloeobacter violaceus]|uniref:DNA topoisomerase 1 n=1 Tax=Gloeobacter violaceus (strain ATCC 29082 / PCC 7421) TaxID=251221 RepID=Q7NGH1_GLOVI|nr:type I DNA topoisomerase [Gloeobacter violaceus]BAC91139.1 DNA topoisomerase I [Gloeobacter violaceus PCC 7421]
MSKSLVIVESPAKAKTISKILGKNFVVKASAGHIRDLPQKEMGVNVKNDFEPKYVIIPKKEEVVEELKGAARNADRVYLAPDPDREGEAIAWHLAQILDIPGDRLQRIEFHEITKQAIQNAVAHPRDIDINRVDAQQARRILDRLVGYKLSPLLWKKVQRGLSAGRVQSVAVRLLCDREKEIQAFVSEEYWTVHGRFRQSAQVEATPFSADLVRWSGKKPDLGNETAARAVVEVLTGAASRVDSVKTRERQKEPQPPFITSTLQREGASALGLTVKRTMAIAQQLYEGIDLGEEGPVGLITYMRTDSTRVAEEAQEAAREFILAAYGKSYYPSRRRQYGAKKGAQDAHECVRPTDINRPPDAIKKSLTPDQFKLYRLIWQRFTASQMTAATLETRTVEIAATPTAGRPDALFRVSVTRTIFDGYTRVYEEAREEAATGDEEAAGAAPVLEEGEALTLLTVDPKQHFTQPPARFSEATLVKALEEQGIGRPSTYAPTIGTIQERGYVNKDGRTLIPTDLGMKVNDQLVQHFPNIVDTEFTANMEAQLDEVEKGSQRWTQLLADFYGPFVETLKAADEEMKRVVIVTDHLCESCGRPLLNRYGRFGNFLGCSGYPECDFTHQLTRDNKPVPKDRPAEGISCNQCGHAPMLITYGRYGEYLKCPACGKSQPKSTGITCPKCSKGQIVERRSKMGKNFYGCDQYPDCDFVLWSRPIDKPACPECGSILLYKPRKRGDDMVACSACKFTAPAQEMVGEEEVERQAELLTG